MKKIFYLIVVVIISFIPEVDIHAQEFSKLDYPKNYFRNPLGIPIQLSANFGELRKNHFHMGFDIRTNQRENLSVYAAADGYISRVLIDRFGYGNAIYITHPNGYVTLYAHLNNFYPELKSYVQKKQYELEEWEVDLRISPGLLPVKKGQFIAYSGNTGGSAGPHLHYEIRDTFKGNTHNPWLVGYNLYDNIKPFIYSLYYYDARYSPYQSGPRKIGISGGGGSYRASSGIVNFSSPEISFGISAEDKYNGSGFRFGIYEAKVWADDHLINAFRLTDFSNSESRYMNACIDYTTKMSTGRYIQMLSILPGNRIPIFSGSNANGVFHFKDSEIHDFKIEVSDVVGNKTVLKFKGRYNAGLKNEIDIPAESVLMYANQPNKLVKNDIQLLFSKNAFYHTVPFIHKTEETNHPDAVSPVHYLHNYKVPVHDYYLVGIKASKPLGTTKSDKVFMKLVSGKKKITEKAQWNNGFYEAKFRELGYVQLFLDTVPPIVYASSWKDGGYASRLSITTKDELGEVVSLRGEVDGQWIMFKRRGNYFTHYFDGHVGKGLHKLKVIVTDVAGNTTEKNYTFRR